jgi:hypothetical protein
MKRWIYILLLPLLVACEKEIHYSGPETNPSLVIEALPMAGLDTLVCYVNRSHFIVDASKTQPEELTNVSIDLSVSSGVCRIVSDSVSGFRHYLKLSNPLPAGDTLRISVSHPDYPVATAEEFILPKLEPTIETIVKDTDKDGRMEFHLSASLPDYPYPDILVGIYGVGYLTGTRIGPHFDTLSQTVVGKDTIVKKIEYKGIAIYSKDELFAVSENRYSLYYEANYITDKGYLFFRTGYSAGRKTQFTLCTGAKNSESKEVKITWVVDSIVLDFEVRSETYNLYCRSMQDYIDQRSEFSFAAGMSVEEPLLVYSNVQNGYGILASQTHTKFVIKDN